VTTPVGAAPDILQHQRISLFVAPRDSRALATSIEHLIANQSLRERLGRAAQRSAENLRPDISAREYCQCFERLATLPSTRQETVATTPIRVKGSRAPISADPIRVRP
jgi:glycosyltransferase involved in cell wall biosynthesis